MFYLPVNGDNRSDKEVMRKEQSRELPETEGADLLFCKPVLNRLSHEMRTNLNAVVALSYLLNRGENLGGDHDDLSEKIFDSCEQLIALFDNFLDSAVISTGELKSELKLCNPGKIFNDLYSEFRETLGKDKYKDIILVVENQMIDTAEVYVDSNRLSRAVRNLFQNSLASTASGYIKTGYLLKDGIIHFTILDSGGGYLRSQEFIQTDDLAESLKKYNDIYTAVSLTLTRKLAAMLGGTIMVECNGLTGSAFHLSVPVKSAVKDENNINKSTNSVIAI